MPHVQFVHSRELISRKQKLYLPWREGPDSLPVTNNKIPLHAFIQLQLKNNDSWWCVCVVFVWVASTSGRNNLSRKLYRLYLLSSMCHKSHNDRTRQDKTAILGEFSPIFCLCYPIRCFSAHMFTEFAYFCLFLSIFRLFSA